MLRAIVAIVKKDLKQAKRDPKFLGPSLIIPFVFLLVYTIMWTSVGGGESFACGLVVEDLSPEANEMADIIGRAADEPQPQRHVLGGGEGLVINPRCGGLVGGLIFQIEELIGVDDGEGGGNRFRPGG